MILGLGSTGALKELSPQIYTAVSCGFFVAVEGWGLPLYSIRVFYSWTLLSVGKGVRT